MDIYVGNLPYTYGDQDLQALFAPHGAVASTRIVMDRETGRSRGFGFVEMDTQQATEQAIAALHEKDIDGRKITVNEARERSPKPPRSGSGYGCGGYGGGGGYSGRRGGS